MPGEFLTERITMSERIYIVTGAAGHLGSHVVRILLEQGHEVRALVLPGENCPCFIDMNRHMLKTYTGDVCIPASLDPLFSTEGRKEFIVIHCAGIVTIARKAEKKVWDVNVRGTANIIAACLRHHVRRLVYISSVHAIPVLPRGQVMKEIPAFNPEKVQGYYDKTKAEATQLVLDAAVEGLDAVVIHPSGIIGPHGLPTGNMMHMIALYVQGRIPIGIQGGFDFVDVRDVADGIAEAVEKGRSGECYILSNRYVGVKELFTLLSRAVRKNSPKRYVPLWLAKVMAPCAELYYRLTGQTPVFTRYSLRTLLENSLYSHRKASRELGYSPRPFEETVRDTAVWMIGLSTGI